MRRIMVLNPKGGCGKTTVATNLASYFAVGGETVALADFDAQGSALDWLEIRPDDRPPIHGLAVESEKDKLMLPLSKGYLVMDAPAATHGNVMKRYVKRAHAIIIPVLPSPFDIRATTHFIHDLLLVGRISREKTQVAVVANRVRENTRIYQSLRRFLDSLEIPFVATLRDSQAYIRAADQGLGIFELPPSRTGAEVEHWEPLIGWLEGQASRPRQKKKPKG